MFRKSPVTMECTTEIVAARRVQDRGRGTRLVPGTAWRGGCSGDNGRVTSVVDEVLDLLRDKINRGIRGCAETRGGE
jgi:hypothetical protein